VNLKKLKVWRLIKDKIENIQTRNYVEKALKKLNMKLKK
jgi:hypothetical protein